MRTYKVGDIDGILLDTSAGVDDGKRDVYGITVGK